MPCCGQWHAQNEAIGVERVDHVAAPLQGRAVQSDRAMACETATGS